MMRLCAFAHSAMLTKALRTWSGVFVMSVWQEPLSLPAVASVGEGELRSLFAGEELRIMLFNYREMGIIPKVEPM
jgi:hypothetical protein